MTKLVLFSGGHDSANLLKRAAPDCLAVFFDYGQPARLQEMRAAITVCADLGVELMIEKMPELGRDGDIHYGRNLLMVAQAIPIAISVGAVEVQIGCIDLDHEQFPDCRPEFIKHLNAATQASYGVKVTAPLTSRPSYIVPGTWSCYGGGPYPCGTCLSCRQGQDRWPPHDREGVDA